MSQRASALYVGSVFHRRFRPREHYLRHALFQLLIDLDEAVFLGRDLRLFSWGRFNLFSVRPQDHGDGSGDLRGWVEAELAAAGVDVRGGPIRMLCIPRILGHAFNPLTVYFAHARTGELKGLIYQVNNTFGERHSYVVPVLAAPAGVVRQSCDKRFYVSPFMDMAMAYDFAIRPPGETISIGVDGRDADGPLIATAFTGRRRALSDLALAAAFATHPLVTLKVVAGIGWGALRLWLKGVRYRSRPPAPEQPTTRVPLPPLETAA